MSSSDVIKGLNSSSYASCLRRINARNKQHGYLYKKSHSDEFIVFAQQIKGQQNEEGFRPLSLRQIIRYGYLFQNELAGTPEDALSVSIELGAMSQKKGSNDKKRTLFIRLIYHICDCTKNLLLGSGFKSTAFLGSKLSEDLAKYAPKREAASQLPPSLPPDIPYRPRVPLALSLPMERITMPKPLWSPRGKMPEKPSEAPRQTFIREEPLRPSATTAASKPAELKRHDSKTKALMDYKQGPENCRPMQRSIIFNDIKFVVPQSRFLDNNYIISAVHLMKYMSGQDEVDLRKPVCGQVVIDVFKECKKAICDDLAAWLCRERTFNVSLLRDCFRVFVDKEASQAPYSLTGLEMLLRHYCNRSWNKKVNAENLPILPANDPVIVAVVEILLRNAPNDDKVASLIEWMMDQREFDLGVFKRWIRVFMEKERTKGATAPNLYYPIRDRLIEQFKRNSWITNTLKEDHTARDIAVYLLKYNCNES